MSETKTNFKNELKSAASLILTFYQPILQHYHIYQNAPNNLKIQHAGTTWITAERKMIRAGIGARVSGDNRKNLSGGIGQSEDTGFVPNVRLVSILFLS